MAWDSVGVPLIMDTDMATLITEVTGQDTIMVTGMDTMIVITGVVVTIHTIMVMIMHILTTTITKLMEEGRHGANTIVQMRIRTVRVAQIAER
jgi:hypothetical protein